MAASGMGVWSLVGQTLCQSVVITTLVWIASTWRPRRKLDLIEVRSVASYSLNLSGFNILNYFVRNSDNILIGRFLGSTALGYYSLAYRLMLYPLQSVSRVAGRVLFPAFARIQDNSARFRQAYLRVCVAISVITFPMMLGLLVVARPFVVVVFGPAWMPVATLLMILAPVGMAQSIATIVGHIYTAKGRTDWMFRWGVLSGVVTVCFFIAGLRWGVVGVAVAYAVRTLILVLPNHAIPFKLIELPVRDLATALWPTLKASLAMAGSVALLRGVLIRLGVAQPIVILAATVPIGTLVYVGLLLWIRPPVLGDVMRMLPLERIGWLQGILAE
jgi:PST family polysaccharide transporter